MGSGFGIAFFIGVVLALVALFSALYFRYRGKRIVTCPETHAPVSAKINAALAAGTWIVSRPRFAITACSRWPERAGCDQACAPQIEASPEETLVHNTVARWYAERDCTYCRKPIREIGGPVMPGLLVDGELHEWKDIAPEDLPRVLEHSVAVCAHCELVEDFRMRHPDLVLTRPTAPAHAQRHLTIADASRALY